MVKRQRKLGLLLAVAIFVALFVVHMPTANAANPTTVSFQGKVVNADGTNVADGNYSFLFKLYTVASAGTAIWTETQSSVTVSAGVFQVNLGSVCPLLTANACNSGAIDFNANPALYLGMTFNGDAAGEMSPRMQMQSVPFAFNADKVGGLSASQLVQLSPGSQQSGSVNVSSVITPALTSAGALSINSGGATNVTVDTGAAGGAVSIGTATATSVGLSRAGQTTTVNGGLSVVESAGFTGSVTMTFGGTENLSITSDQGGSSNGISFVATPSATAGTTNGVFVQQANSANTNGLDSGVTIDNADTDLAVGSAISINNTGGGGYTNLIASTNFNVTGLGALTAGSTIQGTQVNGTTGIYTGASGGTQRIDSSGNITANRLTVFNSGTPVTDIAAFLSGTPVATAGAHAFLMIGSGFSNANVATNGGTYFGLNAPASGLGSAADFLNFQYGATTKFKIDNTGGVTASGTALFQTSGSVALLTSDTANTKVQIGSATAADGTQVNLQLDSSNVFADQGTCTTTTGQGAMYYNTTTNSMRACINGSWEDLASTGGLGVIAFGVVADTGAAPGDISNKSSTTVGAGPCKVAWASATSVTVTACSAYTGGRKVVYAGGTFTGLTTTLNNWTHICFANATTPFAPTSTLNALTATATETANLPQWSANSPVVCVADIKGTGANINIYDTRVFTNSQKSFVNTAVAMGIGWIARDNSATSAATVTTSTLATQASLKGVIVASAGTACTSACGPTAVIVQNGPVYVKSITGALVLGSYVGTSATASYAVIAANSTALNTYQALGIAQTAFVSTCSSAVNCNLSMLVDLSIR